MLALIAGFTVAYWTGVPGTLARRVAIWLDPWGNARTGGDQIAHALWAMASGGIGGMGAGAGDGYLVPAGQTDLILSVVGEELGLAGVVAIAVVYALLIWRMLRIAARAPGDYTAFLALGCALSLAVPAIIIVGGELGALPLSGVATPFLTFGKSSMIANFCAAGIALAIGTRLQPAPRPLARQLRPLGWTLGAAAVLLVGARDVGPGGSRRRHRASPDRCPRRRRGSALSLQPAAARGCAADAARLHRRSQRPRAGDRPAGAGGRHHRTAAQAAHRARRRLPAGHAVLSARRPGVSRHRRSRAPDQLGGAQRLLRRA